MAKTLTEQCALFPNSGATLFTKGDPLHSRFMFDAARHLNNLWAYCDVPVVFCLDPTSALRLQMSTDNISREMYVAQVPILVPAGSKRIVWTLGGNVGADAGGTTTLSAFSLYLSSSPYAGQGSLLVPGTYPFDVTALAPNYCVDTVLSSWSAVMATGGYTFLDRSATGMTPLTGQGDTGLDRLGFLILTVTGIGNYTDGFNANWFDLRDFSAWVLKE